MPPISPEPAGSKQQSAAVVALLRDPAVYPEPTSRVELIETHISWVFLTDDFAYKLKKPVRFDFLDFSSPELRRAACEAEVRLNRRLAADVYLDVVPINATEGRLSMAGEGAAVDWVVKMRRLPADGALDVVIQTGRLTDADIDRITATLANFYRRQHPQRLTADEYRQQIEAHVRANRRELLRPQHQLDRALVKRIHAAQLRLILVSPKLLGDRVKGSHIIEGHGDLRPEHIYLLANPAIIDCIEFSAEFRRIDVVDELSFLAMECAYLDAENVGERVLGQYFEASGDDPPRSLVAFYKSYRACVRAKVLALRAVQTTGSGSRDALQSAQKYLELADRFSKEFGSPLLLVVRGLTGSGKSTLAAALAETLGSERLETDIVRREMFGASQRPSQYNQQTYQPRHRAQVYQEMFRRAETLLAAGVSVILDGTFLTAASRAEATALADKHHADVLIVECRCPEDVALRRIESRSRSGLSASESRPDIYLQQKNDEQPSPADQPICHVDTTQSPAAAVQTVLVRLRGMSDEA